MATKERPPKTSGRWYYMATKERPPKTSESYRLGRELIIALDKGERQKALDLIERNADVNVRDSLRRTSLMIASGKGDLEIAEKLVDKGADILAMDEFDRRVSAPLGTAHRLASDRGHTDVMKMLEDKLKERTKRI